MPSHMHPNSNERLSASSNLGLRGQTRYYLWYGLGGKESGRRLDLSSLTRADMLEKCGKFKWAYYYPVWLEVLLEWCQGRQCQSR